MRTNVKVLALLMAATIGAAYATEWRTPWISERGPIRYTFEKLHNEKKEWNLNLWTTTSMKEAHKAFMKHGFKTQPLTALIFNQADFTLNGVFADNAMAVTDQFYNPFMNITTFQPRASYMEYGMTIGGRVDYPVYGTKGRLGLRANVPFRYIQIQRDDTSDKLQDPLSTVHKTDFVRVTYNLAGADKAATAASIVQADAWRLDFLKELSGAGAHVLVLGDGSGGTVANAAELGGNKIGVDTTGKLPDNATPVYALLKQDTSGKLPYMAFQWAVDTTGIDDSLTTLVNIATIKNPATNAKGVVAVDPATGAFDDKKLNVFGEKNYSAVNNSNLTDKWMVFRYAVDANDPSKRTADAGKLAGIIDFYARANKTGIFQFMADKGFIFETQNRAGIGDCDVDLFYEHLFSKSWMGELSVGMKAPTGGSKAQGTYNPYKPQLGNGGHWELKLGTALAWQPASWINTKLDAYYSFVVQSTEQRPATFVKSTIKNIGPVADADVDWGYFVGRLDFNLFHPKTDTIKSTIGYELYYKTEDRVNFKAKTMAGWNGKKMEATGLTAQTFELDNSLARKNTEAVGHKIRTEASFQVMKYFEIFMGGSTTFAGQNVYRDRDAHGGFNVRF